jgi:ADP-dependent NAD(P)H-hydrate dehydratase / NAD(P)H-hydrate epimerase
MKIVSPHVMAEIDSQAIERFGIPGIVLMENAGIKCWHYINDHFDLTNLKNTSIVIISGSGNNGGDALVIARQAWISGFKNIKIINLKDSGSEMFILHKKICTNYGIPILHYKKNLKTSKLVIAESSLIIDGITGTGLRGSLRSNEADLVEHINSCAGVKISIDIPSGLGEEFNTDYPVINADLTLSIGLPKTILYYPALRRFAGRIIVVSIGFPPMLLAEAPEAGNLYSHSKAKLPVIPDWAYKGTRGHSAIFAGSVGTIGAAVLSAEAAARTRSGLVTLFADNNIYSEAASKLTSIMVKKIDKYDDKLSFEGFSSILAGPGWGKTKRDKLLLKIFESSLPGVLDADGFNSLSGLKSIFDNNPGFLKGKWIFTPHPGEYERLSGIDKEKFLLSPLSYLKKTAAEYGAVLVLKSHVTFIVSPVGEYTVVDGMNPSIGTGGSGDVLAGIITGLLAQGIEPYNAAITGVGIHQSIGKTCFKDKGWFLAEDLLPYISIEMKNMEK